MTSLHSIRVLEFEYRIFVSLGIVWIACTAAYGLPVDRRTVVELLVGPGGRTTGFLAAAFCCAFASILRMTAGTVLHSQRVMSFGVRPEALAIDPPYSLVRNPIYLSDLIAAAGLSLCMPWPGILYPALMSLHYRQLIRWEEASLGSTHGDTYHEFLRSTPRLLPTPASVVACAKESRRLRINYDGARFNGLYVLFVPGLMVAAWSGEFFHAVVIGLPGVADWAYWHTRKGLGSAAGSEVAS